MASADLLPKDVIEAALPDAMDSKPLKEELLYNTTTMPLSDALLNELSSSEVLPSISATEALPCIAISSPSRSTTEALSSCNIVSSSEALMLLGAAVHNLDPTQLTAPLLPQPMENLHATSPPPFLTKLYDMIEDPRTNSTVSWSSGNNSFIVWNLSEFSQCVLPRFLEHNNLSSFVRQLNTYGFKKVNSDCYEFSHEAFLRGQKHLLKDIHRRNSALQILQKNQTQQLQLIDNAMVSMSPESSVQVGFEGEIEKLKGDKCALAAEVVRLRQLQESSERKTLAMIKRVQIAERRQEQMMSFLSKAIQSPAFLAKLVQQYERLRLYHDGRKRKHLPSGTEQPEVALVGVGEPQVPIEIGKESTVEKSMNVDEEMQGISFSMELAGVLDELQYAGRCDLSSVDMSPSCIAMLMRKAREGQSTMSSGTPPHATLATGAKTDTSLDSAIIRRPDGTFEDASDDLDLNFDLHNFIEEIILTAENKARGNADMPDAFCGDFIGQPEVSEACSGSNIATAMDDHPADRATSGRDP